MAKKATAVKSRATKKSTDKPTKKHTNFQLGLYKPSICRPQFEEDDERPEDDREEFEEDTEREEGEYSDEPKTRRRKIDPWVVGVNVPHANLSQAVQYPIGHAALGHTSYVNDRGDVYRSNDRNLLPYLLAGDKMVTNSKALTTSLKDSDAKCKDYLSWFFSVYNKSSHRDVYRWRLMYGPADVPALVVGIYNSGKSPMTHGSQGITTDEMAEIFKKLGVLKV